MFKQFHSQPYLSSCCKLSKRFKEAGKKIASTQFVDNKIQHANANTNETVKIPSNKIFTDSLGLILLGYFNFDRNKHTFEDSLK